MHFPDRLYPLFDPAGVGARTAASCSIPLGELRYRHFPDGESYVRILDDCAGQHVAIFAQLDQPDVKLPGLIFTAVQLREMGAASVGLIAPYLPYMRHDDRFHPGEALSSRIISDWLQSHMDWLLTVDPHLHRYQDLAELYRIPTQALSATAAMQGWLQSHCPQACIVGPDAESEQWVRPLAEQIQAPWWVLRKVRSGDRDVAVSTTGAEYSDDEHSIVERMRSGALKPVLVDDILSTGMTIKQAAEQLADLGITDPVCLVTHALFSDHHPEDVAPFTLDGSVQQIISSNTIAHPSNGLDITPVLATALSALKG